MPNGQIGSVTLAAPSWYRGKMYPGGTKMKFDKNGDVSWDSFYDKLLSNSDKNQRQRQVPVVLSAAEVHRGTLLPAGSLLYPETRRGRLRAIVPKSFDYLGLRIHAGEIQLGQNGSIRHAHLDGDQVFNGLRLKGFPMSISLTDTGDLISARLAIDQTVMGLPLKGTPSNVEFGRSGDLIKATLSQDTEINGITFTGNRPIEFGKSGYIANGTIALPTRLNKILFPAGSRLKFYSEGILSQVELAKKTMISGVEIPAKTRLSFVRDNIIRVKSNEKITASKNTYSGDGLVLRGDGTVIGLLLHDAIIDKQFVEAGTQVEITANGGLIGREFVGLPYEPVIALVNTSGRAVVADDSIDLSESPCLQILGDPMLLGSSIGSPSGKSVKKECVDFLISLEK